MAKTKKLPPRSKVKPEDTWDLASLFDSDTAWESAFLAWEKQIPKFEKFRGKLGDGPKAVADCLKFDTKLDREGERLGTYAFLRTTEDTASSTHQAMQSRYHNAASRAAQAASFIRPELLALSDAKIRQYLAAKELAPYRLVLERIVRYKPYTLGDKEERLLAMQSEMAHAADHIFRQLTDADLKFGFVENEKGESVELSNSTFSLFLHSPSRAVRKEAFHKFYAQYAGHENSLAAALKASVQRDIYYAKARGYDSALGSALFADDVPVSVYDNLIGAVRSKLPALYKYFEVRRKRMKLRQIHHYDTYVPILAELDVRHTWQQATDKVVASLAPLGKDYCSVLEAGLRGRWCDRYPNQGKQSGAFSCGSFDGDPYILMNYQPDVLDHVFTLTHEAGHSMHSHLSSKSQPFEYYNYVIFVAEVASTFNEQLLSRYMMENAKTKEERAYLVNREIDAIRGTIIRQTMFAEFEKVIHALAEANEALTVDRLKKEYRMLLEAYFGPGFAIDPELELECLRIPHFYRAFYVYKYATGLSAAIALSDRVLNGGKPELDAYLNFLRGGCSKYPLELLRDAGVDMASPRPVAAALEHFERLVDELDSLLG